MTFADNKCECCGHDDFPAGVASSGIAALSLMWCSICLRHGAEPRVIVEALFEQVPDPKAHPGILYYDPDDDTYKSAQTGEVVPVTMTDGTQYRTRAEVVQALWSKTPEPPPPSPGTEIDFSKLDMKNPDRG